MPGILDSYFSPGTYENASPGLLQNLPYSMVMPTMGAFPGGQAAASDEMSGASRMPATSPFTYSPAQLAPQQPPESNLLGRLLGGLGNNSHLLLAAGANLASGGGIGGALQGVAQAQRTQQDDMLKRALLQQSLFKDARDFQFRTTEAGRAQQNADRSFGFQQTESGRAQTNADRAFSAQFGGREETIKALIAKGLTPEIAAAVAGNPTLLSGYLSPQLGISTGGTDDIKELDRINQERKAAGQPSMTMEQLFRAKKGGDVEADVQTRARLAEGQGLKVGSPAYQAFVLTGKMPREDQQPLSATDKKAIMEADEAVLAANTAIDALGAAKRLSKEAFQGPLATERGYAASLFGSKAGEATTDLNNQVTSNALGQLKAIFGGNPTEGERKILLEIQGSASQPDTVRQKIYDRAMALADRRLQFNKQRADELRGGSFYKQPGVAGAAVPAPTNAASDLKSKYGLD